MSPLYARVCDQILARIQSGALRVGDRLPPEEDYAAELGISRSTLRLAYSELEAAGVLQRRKRAGTEIISDTPQRRFSMATRGVGELLSLGRDTEFEITDTRVVRTGEIPQLQGLNSETGHWLEIHGTRTLPDDPRPFSVNRVYVPARFASIEPLLGDTGDAVFRTIETTFDVVVGRVSQTVRALPCPPAEAAIMGLPAAAPALRIEARLFVRGGPLMEVSVATFDPDRFQVHTDVNID